MESIVRFGPKLALIASLALAMGSAMAAQAAADTTEPNATGGTISDPATTVVATRDGVTLTVADVDAKVRSMPPELRAGYLNDAARMSRLIDTMLLSKQLAADGENSGLHQKPEFQADLRLLRDDLLARAETERHMSKYQAPNLEQLAREHYMASKEKYRPKPQFDVRHILIATEGRGEEEALKIAEEALARAKAGEDFVALVAEYSPSPDGIDKSLLKNPDPSRLDLNFLAAVDGMKNVGDVAGPVRSKFGYHVLRLERRETFDLPSFEQLKPTLVGDLRERSEAAERARFLRSYTEQPTELNNQVIRALPRRYLDLHRGAEDAPPTADSGD